MLKIVGFCRLTRDPVLKEVGNTHVANFGVAVNEVYKKENGDKVNTTHFFECELWGAGAQTFHKYLHKGDLVMIEGRPKYDTWVDKESGKNRNKVYFRVDQFQMMGKNQSSDTDDNVPANSADVPDEASDDHAPF